MSERSNIGNSLVRFTKRVVNSRLGQILFAIHLGLVIYAIAEKMNKKNWGSNE